MQGVLYGDCLHILWGAIVSAGPWPLRGLALTGLAAGLPVVPVCTQLHLQHQGTVGRSLVLTHLFNWGEKRGDNITVAILTDRQLGRQTAFFLPGASVGQACTSHVCPASGLRAESQLWPSSSPW